MPVKQISPETRVICRRFARAYQELRYLGKVSTKGEYAESLGMASSSNLLRIERNESYEPSLNSIYLLLKINDVNPDWLFFGEGEFIRK